MKGLISLLLLSAVAVSAQIEESAVEKYPRSLEEVPANLRYPVGASFGTDRDGNFLVNGKIRHIIGAQPSKGYRDIDFAPTPGYPAALNWIYEELLNYENAQRLGLDSVAPFTSNAFVNRIVKEGYRRAKQTPGHLKAQDNFANFGLPIQVDFTSVPWDKGMFNSNDPILKKYRSEDALNAYHQSTINHWVPYNIFHPDARKIYRTYWEAGVDELKGKSPVLDYELFNEPAYDDFGSYNRGLFETWLKRKYRTVSAMNKNWGSSYKTFRDAANFKRKTENAGLAVDWGKFLEEGFTDLCRYGADVIRKKVPDARISMQPLGGGLYRRMTRSNVNPYEINKYLNVISVTTGGGIAPRGGSSPAARAIDTPANSPYLGEGILERWFFRAIGEGKPIVNGELYVGKKASEIRRALWLDLLRGSNASYVFEWSKRAWDWRPKNAEGGKRCAEREPYHLINPYNKAELYGIMQAKKEIFRFADFFVPRNRNIKREVALMISYPTERRSEAVGNVVKDEITAYASALEFSHIPSDAILEEQLAEGRQKRYRAIVAAGVRNIYPETAGYLIDYVKKGGVLILAREFMQEDEYGHPVDWQGIFKLRTKTEENAPTAPLVLDLPNPELLPGERKGRNSKVILSAPGWEVLGRSGNAPVLLRKKIGKGAIWLLTPEMQDYQIAAQLQSILALSGIRPQVRLARAKEQDLAVNVEIHAAKRGSLTLYFLLNQDTYPKLVDFSTGETGKEKIAILDALHNRNMEKKNGRARIILPADGYGILAVGPENAFSEAFGACRPVSRSEIEKEFAQLLQEYRANEREKERGKFRFHPDLSLTRTIDLRLFCNRGFVDSVAEDGKGGWTDQGRENSFTGVPWGIQNFLGVPCDIIRFDANDGRTCIVLASKSQKAALPKQVTGIRISGRVRALYFFHTAAWVRRGEVALTYRIHYRSGRTLDVPAVIGTHIGNWWHPGGELSRYVAFRNRFDRGFYCMEWENPNPEDEVLSLDLVSPNSKVVPIVIGITAEELGARKLLSWSGLRGYGWGKAVPSYRNGECEVRISGKTDPWAGFTCAPESDHEIFRLSPEEWKQAHLLFRINGGMDRYGNPKGGQSLKMTLRSRVDGKEISSDPLNVSRFLEEKTVDAVPGTFQTVSVPLREFRNTAPLKNTIAMVGLQFNGTGAVAGVILRDFRLVIPEKNGGKNN